MSKREPMTPETAISLALFALYKRKGEQPTIGVRKDVLSLLLELKEKGIPSQGLKLRKTPEGVESEEVSSFVGRLAMGGYLVQESPIRLTQHGIDFLRAVVSDESEVSDVEGALEVLGLSA